MEDPLLGRTLPGGYIILELIGVGGMGRVYRGEQQVLGRTVAVKVIHAHLLGDESTAMRFITEARAASRLNHPNSVGVIDFGKTDDGQLYLVMEFLRGRDLARVVQEEGPLPFRRILKVLRQVLAALGEAHELGIIHRDLKPENIVLERVRGGEDFVKVVDFGLAKLVTDTQSSAVTRPGIVCGTPDYMAPEQGRGDVIDARTDLYSVGVILFLLLTGRLPFEADSPTQVVLMHLTIPPPDPRRAAADRAIPDALAEACLRALAKDPNDRFAHADAFSAVLTSILEQLEERSVIRSRSGVHCPVCGHANPSGQKFCGECGVRLSSSTLPEALAQSRAFGPATRSDPGRFERGSTLLLPLPLLHRHEDLAWLDDQRTEVHGALLGVRLVGEDGAGKTRLLHEFLAIARAAGDRVVEGAPDPWWADVGYWPLAHVITGLAELPPGGGPPRDWLGAGTEARRGLLEIFGKADEASGPLAPDQRRYLAAEALRWALIRAVQIAGKHRVLVVLDDLHRMDGASRNAFADALTEPPLVPILLVATHTPGFDSGWVLSAARVLSGLPAPAVIELVQDGGSLAWTTEAPGSPTGFPPMYAEQLLRFTQEGGRDAPTRLVDMLSLRIERLPPAARRALQALAVLGDETTAKDITALLSDGVDVQESLSLLARSGMIEPPAPDLRIAHPLLREVVGATIPAAVRRELHTNALAIAQERGQPLEVRAWHALHAEDAFEALLLLEQVAVRACARGDLEGAILALRRGLDMARREFFRGELDDPAHAVLIFSRKLGETLAQMGSFTDADGVLREALDLAGPAGSERARVLGALARVAHGRSRVSEASQLLREAIEVARRTGEPDLLQMLERMSG